MTREEVVSQTYADAVQSISEIIAEEMSDPRLWKLANILKVILVLAVLLIKRDAPKFWAENETENAL